VMVDRLRDPLMAVQEAARHLDIPPSTLGRWIGESAADAPLVHGIPPAHRGAPSLPFVAIVESYVVRSLRELGLSMPKIREAATVVREEFDTPYGLATRRIATDGVDIFTEIQGGELVRVRDRQQPFREVIEDYLRYVHWDAGDQFPDRLRLRQYPDVAPVIIDPRFGWGSPVVEQNKVQIDAIVGMWRAGESLETVADEYDLTRDQVEAICQHAPAA
jgi:uncharacterized protein (DUF433 family)